MTKKAFNVFIVLAVAAGLASPAFPASPEPPSARRAISLTDKPANTPFSPAILVKDTLFISGQLSVNPETGKFEGATMTEQADRIIRNIEVLCRKAGLDLSHVVETTAFITDFGEFGEFNTVFRKYFAAVPPTRATVQVSKLAMGAKIEISAVAVK